MELEFGKNGYPSRNLKTGQFLPGHIPHNVGKSWDEWMPKRKRKKVLEIGMKNLRGNMNLPGWNKRAVVAVNDKGKHAYCESAAEAARIRGIQQRNIISCCQGKRKKCGGLRWFYYDDDRWMAYQKERIAATQAETETIS